MPFPFVLPTTSSVLLTDFFDSVTHPSLPLTATTQRSVLKDVLKRWKRLSPSARATELPAVQEAISAYLPYLSAISAGTSYRDVGPEKIDVVIKKPLQVEWRSTLSATFPGRDPVRPRLIGLHYEIAFSLITLAYVQTHLAREQLRRLYGSSVLSAEQRTATISTAMKHLLEAHSICNHLATLPAVTPSSDGPVDVLPSTASALAALALAEANIAVVAKDDPYAAMVADERNENNTDWMFKAPTINKTRVRLLATICLRAAEHAGQAHGLLTQSAGRVDGDLVKYVFDLRRTARSRAIRFFAIEAESNAKTGEAIAWLKGARKELGRPAQTEDKKRKGLSGLKQSWQERREDRKVEKGGEWGLDAGRYEEVRVVEMLEAKWEKENSIMNVQVVPPSEPLLASMPGGRDFPHAIQPFTMPTLDSIAFARIRAPPEPNEAVFRGEEDVSDDEYEEGARAQAAGAFPETGGDNRQGPSYY